MGSNSGYAHKMLIKISTEWKALKQIFKKPRCQELMILSSYIKSMILLKSIGSLQELLKLLKCPACKSIQTRVLFGYWIKYKPSI